MLPSAELAPKAFLMLMILSAFGGAFLGWRSEKTATEAVLGFFVVPGAVCLALITLAGLFYAIKYIVGL